MCMITLSPNLHQPLNLTHGINGTARKRRRSRRREKRQFSNGHEGGTKQESAMTSRNILSPSNSGNSTTSESASWSSESCSSLTLAPVSNQHNPSSPKMTKKKTRRRKRKGIKKELPVLSIEEIPEEEKQKYLAMDCEMVGVGRYGHISALARVSITDWEGDVLLDKFVKVEQPVTDYRTHVSGIRAADIESDDALNMKDCREMVMNIISDKIVVGHALRNDFYALKITHPWHMIRDTARYEPFMKEDQISHGILIPKKLRELARDKLGLTIQEEGNPHDSIQDANAAMELYKKARRKWEKAIEWKMNKTMSILEEECNFNHYQASYFESIGTM